jgi:hypothetical protein
MPAGKATDGNTEGDYYRGSVAHTAAEPSPWWEVDLGSSATIDTVVVWNRTDCCKDRLADYWVFVSDVPFKPSDTPAALQSRATTWSIHQTAFPDPFSSISVGARGRHASSSARPTTSSLPRSRCLGGHHRETEFR